MINLRGALAALGAALLFGAAAPAAKILVGDVAPLLLAGLLYLGSGAGLAIVWLVRRRSRPAVRAPIPRGGRVRFALAVVAGGMCAPALLMLGLAHTSASTSSLLLNLEAVFTAVIAWVVMREHTHARIVLGFVAIAAGAALLSFDPAAALDFAPGALLIAGACLCWAVDNNLTQAVSSADPVMLATVKGLAAGVVNTAIAFAFAGAVLPAAHVVVAALVVGFAGYGVSLVLFVVSLRRLGTARTGAYFATAPFVGALLSLAVLHEPLTWPLVAAGALMAVGLALHLTERHGHEHAHEALVHSHEHSHDDDHHNHAHPPGTPSPHTHEHAHDARVHAHAHAPDIHHRHAH